VDIAFEIDFQACKCNGYLYKVLCVSPVILPDNAFNVIKEAGCIYRVLRCGRVFVIDKDFRIIKIVGDPGNNT
jgi:hypothetical protein